MIGPKDRPKDGPIDRQMEQRMGRPSSRVVAHNYNMYFRRSTFAYIFSNIRAISF